MCVCVRVCVRACVRGRVGGWMGGSISRKYSFQMALMHISTLNYANFTGMLTIHMYYTVPVTYETYNSLDACA